MSENSPIRVLVVDDSKVVCRVLSNELNKDPDLTVVGTAPDPYVAREMILQHEPQVITLDLEMPRMDGLSFLRKLMKHHPLPVIIVSSTTPKGCSTALKAIAEGAVDVMSKPREGYTLGKMTKELIRKIKVAATIDCDRRPIDQLIRSEVGDLRDYAGANNIMLAMGASAGGTVVIEKILKKMPPNLPGAVVVQHMPEIFTEKLAARLDSVTKLSVSEAQSGDVIESGRVLIAPGGKHLLVKKNGESFFADVRDGPTVNRHRPSVDVLFNSVARAAGPKAVGVLLTGMGNDGAAGLLEMRRAGASTIAQDESTSVVFGMPRVAIECGAADEGVPLDRIPGRIIALLEAA